jgi:hypothetical protein
MLERTTRWFGPLSLFAVLIFFVAARPASAQVLYSSVVGTVTDPSGAAVPGATVTVTQEQTHLTRSVVTDSSGGYTVATLPSGTYDVRVSAKGFKLFVKRGVTVAYNSAVRVDATLAVGAITQTVEVTSAVPLLQTTHADVHHNISAEQIENVPMAPGNNFEQLFRAVPGLNPPSTAHSIPTNPSRALSFFSNGTSDLGNSIQIDGVSQWNIWVPENAAYIPSSDAIQVVNVATNNYNINQGFAGGTAANVEIKSGTNQIHGDVYEYHYDNALEALDYFAPRERITRTPKDIWNQWGGSIGGPIKHDKLFYFSNVELSRDYLFANNTGTVPTAAMIHGDLRGLLGTAPGVSQVNGDVVYDPATGNANGTGRTQIMASDNPASPAYNALCLPSQANSAGMCGNVIPTSRISPVAAKLMSMMPSPNLLSTNSGEVSSNYIAGADAHFNRITTDDKINWNATNKFTMFGHFGYLKYSTFNPTMLGPDLQGDGISGYIGNPGKGNGHTITASITGNYVASSNFVVDGNFGFTREVTNSQQVNLGTNEGLALGIAGTNGTRPFEGSTPQLNISGFTLLGTQYNFMPYFRNDPQFFWSGNANWIHGKHTINFGGAYMIQHLNQQQPEWNAGGTSWPAAGGLGFGSGPTQLCETGKGTTGCKKTSSSNNYNDFGTFLLGLDTGWGRNIQVPNYFHTVTDEIALYVGDTYQVTRKLTATYGVRWEYDPFPTRSGVPPGVELYNFSTGLMENCGEGGVPLDCGVSVSKHQFSPRLGLAYRLTPTTVIRAGYGITTDPFNVIDDIRTNFPILIPLAEGAPTSLAAAGVLDPASLQNSPGGECAVFPSYCFGTGGTLPVGIINPSFPSLTAASNPVPGNVNLVTTPAKRLQRAYIQSWNFTVQKELPGNWVATAGYVATRTVNLTGWWNQNAAAFPGGGAASQFLNYNASVPGACTSAASTALGCRTGATVLITPIGNDIYDSLQATLTHHFSHGLDVHMAYTWSKAIGECGVNDEKSSACIQTPAYYGLNRGYAPFDRPHNFEATAVWQPFFGPGQRFVQTGAASKILGGWQLSGLVTSVSQTPVSFSASGSSLDMPGDSQRPDRLCGTIPITKQIGPGQPWFDPNCFTGVNTARFGTSAFYVLHGPNLFDTDMALFRNFKLTERFNLQFRAQAFNIFNHPLFGNPNGSCDSISSTTGFCSNGSFGTIQGTTNLGRHTGEARLFEFSARLSF